MFAAALVDTRREYEHVFSIYVPIAVGVFVVIAVAIGAAIVRYRGRPPERAARWHENNRLEAGYAAVLAMIVAFLLYVTFASEHRVDAVSAHERPYVTIEVTASKWEWTFYYPAYRITQRSGTVGREPLVVPTNEAVRFELASVDVIHSFWIPQLRFKRDAIPGAVQTVTLDFAQAGSFSGACAEFCGLRHADMVFDVRAVAPSAFGAWATSGGRASAA